MYMRSTVTAFFTVSSAILRPKKCPLARFRNTATEQETSTARVVVFMPPAVEPGLPPTSIRRMVTIRPTSLSWVRSEVLKPAVLGVTAWKSDAQNRWEKGRPPYSPKKK